MISQYEVSSLLRKEIPQLAGNVYPSKVSLEVYASMNYFSDFTRGVIEIHDYNLAEKCFNLADKLYREGDSIVRLLIKKIFVHEFATPLQNDNTESLALESIMPPALYSLYLREMI